MEAVLCTLLGGAIIVVAFALLLVAISLSVKGVSWLMEQSYTIEKILTFIGKFLFIALMVVVGALLLGEIIFLSWGIGCSILHHPGPFFW